MKTDNINSVDQYIASFEGETAKRLKTMRQLVLNNAPDAKEGIFYGMPGYKLFAKPLVYFAAFKNHIGFYATPTGHAQFAEDLSKYKQGKGSVQFPLDEDLPIKLIANIIKFRVKENKEQSQKSSTKKK